MLKAEFFDIFGSIGFLILLITGFYLKKKSKAAWIIIVISAVGLIVDLYVVLTNFIIN